MKKIIKASVIEGELIVPTSKSYLIRALFASHLFDTKTIISNPNYCDDVNTVLDVLESLGARFVKANDMIEYVGKSIKYVDVVNCGESGLCFRMLSAINKVLELNLKITGKGSLLNRNMSDIEKNIKEIQRSQKIIRINSNKSSQFLSGLLLSLPLLGNETVIEVDNLVSKPYIDLTIHLMEEFGFVINNDNYKRFYLQSANKVDYILLNPEADWSSAAFLLVAAAIAGHIKLKGMNLKSKQPDNVIVDILKSVGANIKIDNFEISVKKNKLNSFSYDATNSPDLIPVLVALAVNCESQSVISGIDRLVNKESNRIHSLLTEFLKLGCIIKVDNNSFIVEKSEIQGCEVLSYNDHRIAMSLAIAALNANSTILINNSECVKKSYPNFFSDLKIIGGNI